MKKLVYAIALIVGIAGVSLELWILKSKGKSSRPTGDGVILQRVEKDPDAPLDKFKQVPEFDFTDRDHQKVNRGDLRGKVWLADFIYTTCPDTCPMLSRRLSNLQERALALGEEYGGDGVRLVSFSVDPEHDTPEILSGYAKALGATPKWHFLTGDLPHIQRVAREGFLIGFEKVPGVTDEISHSTKIALVDQKGIVRRYYDGIGDNDESEQILKDVRKLLEEAKK